MDDKKARVDQLAAALVLAFAAADGAAPVTILRPVAEFLDDFGIRQTDVVDKADLEAKLSAVPGWQKERIREESQDVPVEPDHHAVQSTPRVAKAPKVPKKIPAKLLGTVKNG